MQKIKPVIMLLLTCGCMMKTPRPATLRIVSAIPDSDVRIDIQREGQTISASPSFMEAVPYRSMPSGKAQISLSSDGKTLLKKEIGLGNGGKYTLVFEGLGKLSSEPNQETFDGKVHRVFGGVESASPNGFLPGLVILKNEFSVQKGKAKLRVVNAVVGAQVLSIGLKTSLNGDNKFSLTLSYPQKSNPASVKAGNYELDVKVSGMPEAIFTQQLHLEPCKFYTLVLSGNATGSRSLQAQVLQDDGMDCP